MIFFWILCAAVVALILFILLAYFYMTRNFNYWKKRGVTEISPVPFVGNFGKYFKHELSPGDLLKSFYDQNEGLPYVGIYILDKPCLLLRDPEIIKNIFIKDFHFFLNKFSHSGNDKDISNNSILFINNPEWKFARPKFTNMFTTSKLKSMFDVVEEVGKDFYEYLDSLQLEGPGKAINIEDVAAKFNTDLIGLATFGLKLNSLKDPNSQFRKHGKEMFGTYSIKRAVELTAKWLAPQYTSIFDFRFFPEKPSHFFRKAFQEIVDERINSKVKRNDFIDLMIQLQGKEDDVEYSGYKFEDDNLFSQALFFFAAGFSPSSTIMSNALFELAKHPDIQTKLRNEINNAIAKNNGKKTYEMVSELQFLDMIISETLRMHPTLPVLDRKATSDYEIDGLTIEKGTPVLVPMLGLHFDPKYFPNPLIFDPERFSSDQKSLRNPYVYMPFGMGHRSCMGRRQGILQTKIGVVYVISKFEVSLLDKDFVELNKLSVLNSSKGGLFLKMRKLDESDTN